MSVSTKELFTAFFKGLAFAKGLNFGDKNRGMAEDRWITIHPFGNMKQGEADAGEGKGYYKRIFIDDETGEIEKGLGAGTNIKDLSKTLKAKKNGQENESTSKKTVKEPTTLRDKIKALTEGKEYTEEVANKVGDLLRQELLANDEFKKIISEVKQFDANDIKFTSDVRTEFEKLLNVDPEYKRLSDIYHDEREIEGEHPFDRFARKVNENKEVNKRRSVLWEMARQEALKEYGRSGEQIKTRAYKVVAAMKQAFDGVLKFSPVPNFKKPKDLKERIDAGLSIYPENLMKVITDSNFSIGQRKNVRASCRHDGKITVDRNDHAATIAHEFAHLIESNSNQILKLEEDFYNRRTKGEDIVYLRQYTGKPYENDETTRPDNFLEPYMGREYTDYFDRPSGYELLSCGVEMLIEDPGRLTKDPDYMNFVLGCLACKD